MYPWTLRWCPFSTFFIHISSGCHLRCPHWFFLLDLCREWLGQLARMHMKLIISDLEADWVTGLLVWHSQTLSALEKGLSRHVIVLLQGKKKMPWIIYISLNQLQPSWMVQYTGCSNTAPATQCQRGNLLWWNIYVWESEPWKKSQCEWKAHKAISRASVWFVHSELL